MKKVQERLNKSKYYQLAKNRFVQDRERLVGFFTNHAGKIIIIILISAKRDLTYLLLSG